MPCFERGLATAKGLVLSAFATALLSGCVVGPDYRKPLLAMPASWSGQKTARPAKPVQLSQWWQRLRDPELNALVAEAVAGNLDVATAKAKIREARATYRQSVGTLLPSADGSASATRKKVSATSAGTTASGTYSQYQAGFDASWELDLFGANRRGVEATGYGLDASEEALRSTLLTLVGDVTSNYIQARGYQARIALARRSAASQRQIARLTRTKALAGLAAAADVAKAEGQASGTEAAIPSLEASYAEAVHRLSVLTGRPPAGLTERLKRTAPIPAPRLPIPTGIPADILMTRPDVRMEDRSSRGGTLSERQLDRQHQHRIPQARRSRQELHHRLVLWSDAQRAAGQCWPVAGGRRRRQSPARPVFIAYRASVLTALEDVENALVSLAQERIRIGKLASPMKSYAYAAQMERTLYKAGEASLLDVLDTERSAYSAEDALLQSRVSIATDYVALNKALGGGWDGVVDSTTPEVIDVTTGPRLEH